MELETLKRIISEVKNIDPNQITEDMDFINDLSCDSIEVFQIIMGLEEAFNIKIENDQLLNIKTVRDAVEKIKNGK